MAKKTTEGEGLEIDVSEFDGEPELPLDTIGGIMQKISRINAEAKKATGKRRQCPSTLATGKRSVSITFCTLDDGHDGAHKGYRKTWPNTSEPTGGVE